MISTLRALGVVLLLSAAATATGCGSLTGEYCDLRCQCEGCSDNQLDQCIVEQDARADQADLYGCAELNDIYLQCVADYPICSTSRFETAPACAADKDRRDNCVDGSSSNRIRIDLRAP